MRRITTGVYRHFKGNLYRVLHIAQNTETKEEMVVYQALYGDFGYYIRPYEMFASKVDKDKYPDATQNFRFEQLDNFDDDLDFTCNTSRPDFVFRAEKELQKAANDLEQAARRGAPQADIFNLQRKVEYKQYVLGLLKGR